ncbi:MAG TPA: tetratricopeptide repeat protein [Micromonospora sp.]|nr:tetratricopeptide repeat protein [Micromonospora sp.]
MIPPSPLAAAQRDAQALRSAGNLAGARELLTYVLESARPSVGEDHPEVLAAAYLLARLHREADDPAAARRVLEEAFAAGQRRLGDADPLLLAISFDLGSVAEELGNRHEARRNFSRLVAAGPAVFGDDHWMVRAARGYLDDQPPASAPPAPDHPVPAPVPPPRIPPAPAVPQPVLTPPAPQVPAYPVPPAGPLPHPAPPSPPPLAPIAASTAAPARNRAAVIAAAVAAAVAAAAAVLAVLALVVVLSGGSGVPRLGPEQSPQPKPTLGGAPPADLQLRDDGASITISWTDPTAGAVPFIIAGGKAGQPLNALATIGPGETRYTINGLSLRIDYCFTVLAVYSTDRYATSGQVCTDRATTAPAGSPS